MEIGHIFWYSGWWLFLLHSLRTLVFLIKLQEAKHSTGQKFGPLIKINRQKLAKISPNNGWFLCQCMSHYGVMCYGSSHGWGHLFLGHSLWGVKDGVTHVIMGLPLRTPRPAAETRDGPTRNFHQKYRKICPPKYLKIPKKMPPKPKKSPVWVFWGVFGGQLGGFQNFGPGGIFPAFFVEILGWAIPGLCSRSGHSQGHPLWEGLPMFETLLTGGVCGSLGVGLHWKNTNILPIGAVLSEPRHLHPVQCSPCVPATHLPKGPFHTKNSTAPEPVVLCCRRSFSVSVYRFPASFS